MSSCFALDCEVRGTPRGREPVEFEPSAALPGQRWVHGGATTGIVSNTRLATVVAIDLRSLPRAHLMIAREVWASEAGVSSTVGAVRDDSKSIGERQANIGTLAFAADLDEFEGRLPWPRARSVVLAHTLGSCSSLHWKRDCVLCRLCDSRAETGSTKKPGPVTRTGPGS